MTIHAQEGKSYADCLKQSWNTNRMLTQATKPALAKASNDTSKNVTVPLEELVTKVIKLVEVGLSEIEPVKAIAAADKMRSNVSKIFGELIKTPPKTSAKTTKPKDPRQKKSPQKSSKTPTKHKTPKNSTTQNIQPTPGNKRLRSPDTEDEQTSPCRKQVILTSEEYSEEIDIFDLSLLRDSPTKETLVSD